MLSTLKVHAIDRLEMLDTKKSLLKILLIIWLGYGSAATASDEHMNLRLRACAGCHEPSDAANFDKNYAPSISGKPVEYLYQQLLNFQEGRRLNTVMNQMLAYLSPGYLHEIASYYAQQDITTSEPEQKQLSIEQSARAQLIFQQGSAGKAACVACHGGDLRGNAITIPSLRGLSATYITAQLGAWQTNTRHARSPDCMADVAKSLSGADIDAVAHWIASVNEEMLEAKPPLEPLPVECGAVQ